MWKMVKIKQDWRIQALCDVTLCCWVNDTSHGTAWPLKTKELQSFATQEPRVWQSITSQKPESLATQQCQLEISQVTRRTFRLNSAVQAVRHAKPFCALPIAISADLEKILKLQYVKYPVNISLNIIKIIKWPVTQAAVMWPAWDEECNMKTNSGDIKGYPTLKNALTSISV